MESSRRRRQICTRVADVFRVRAHSAKRQTTVLPHERRSETLENLSTTALTRPNGRAANREMGSPRFHTPSDASSPSLSSERIPSHSNSSRDNAMLAIGNRSLRKYVTNNPNGPIENPSSHCFFFSLIAHTRFDRPALCSRPHTSSHSTIMKE